ncbi:hypothetical protein PH505_bb00140 [Pseudoalteromonas distincta]|uniref:hypothetical protein n=1 Tax=Pseudoalteromonas distincta TaxID=77608 RepID=UPI00020A0BB3|nr:hypothetical protein [Pseudoalteromonas distincta]EGI72866.1 hypothetical protein PH505_bb00140 [Pseudoalteromonas distincta]
MPDFRFINSRPFDLREVEEGLGKMQRRKTAKEVEKENNDKDTARRAKQLSEFSAYVFDKPLEPWQTHFLEFATQELLAGHKLQIAPSPRGKKLVNVSVTICAFDVMRDLTQSEFEKAVLLHGEVTLSAFLLLPSIRHYLDRAVFFAQLSEQTNNLVHITKAYKRAHLVCMVLKYFLKDKHSDMTPSARLRAAIKKGLYA